MNENTYRPSRHAGALPDRIIIDRVLNELPQAPDSLDDSARARYEAVRLEVASNQSESLLDLHGVTASKLPVLAQRLKQVSDLDRLYEKHLEAGESGDVHKTIASIQKLETEIRQIEQKSAKELEQRRVSQSVLPRRSEHDSSSAPTPVKSNSPNRTSKNGLPDWVLNHSDFEGVDAVHEKWNDQLARNQKVLTGAFPLANSAAWNAGKDELRSMLLSLNLDPSLSSIEAAPAIYRRIDDIVRSSWKPVAPEANNDCDE
jgi:hypothetical protein